MKLILNILLILLSSHLATANQDKVSCEKALLVNELKTKMYAAFAYGRDEGREKSFNPKMVDYINHLNKAEEVIPEIRQLLAESIQSNAIPVDVQAQATVKAELNNFTHQGIKLIHGLEDMALLDQPWQRFNPSIARNALFSHGKKLSKTYEIEVDGKIIEFFFTKQFFEIFDSHHASVKEVYQLDGRYILVRSFDNGLFSPGSSFLMYVESDGSKSIAEPVGELYAPGFIKSMSFNDFEKVSIISKDTFVTHSEYGPTSLLWSWNTQGEFQLLKKFVLPTDWSKTFSKENNRANSAILMGEDQMLISYEDGLRLWQMDVEGKKAEVLNFAETKNSVYKLLKVDESHFFSFHWQGHIVLWRLNEDAEIEQISTMGGRSLESSSNLDLTKGHLSAPKDHRYYGEVKLAALVKPNQLLTAGDEGRMILWGFDLEGHQEVLETFPNENPKFMDTVPGNNSIILASSIIMRSDFKALRWKYKNDQLYIEVRDKKNSYLWRPAEPEEVFAEGEL